MNTEIAFEVASAIVLSLGGGGIIVFALSNWLGKIWADRLMVREAARHSQDLATLNANLQERIDHFSQTYKQKIELYKEVSNPLIDLVVKAQHSGLTPDDLKDFDKNRLTTTALLAMFAPARVFSEYNNLIDSFEGKDVWSFPEFRVRALRFLSLVRADIGLYADDIYYSGNR